jgi:hypothetical protein
MLVTAWVCGRAVPFGKDQRRDQDHHHWSSQQERVEGAPSADLVASSVAVLSPSHQSRLTGDDDGKVSQILDEKEGPADRSAKNAPNNDVDEERDRCKGQPVAQRDSTLSQVISTI